MTKTIRVTENDLQSDYILKGTTTEDNQKTDPTRPIPSKLLGILQSKDFRMNVVKMS